MNDTATTQPDDAARSDGPTEPVRYERVGDVAVVSLDDGKANALSFGVLDALDAALDRASGDGTKSVAIIGRPGKFSAGFDLKVMTAGIDGARRMLGTGAELGLRMFTYDLPVVLGLTGHALAMGGILSTCADWRVAGQGEFKLGLNEVAIGMPVPMFGVELCRNRLSPRWFDRCVGQAYLCNPDEAVEAGFADEVVPLDQVRSRAIERAAALAASVHLAAFRITRENCRGELAGKLRNSLDADLALFDLRD